MDKSKKSSRYLHLHRVPFVLLWMSTYAMGWAAVLLLYLVLALIELVTPGAIFFNGDLALFGALVGLTFGVVTAWAQPWLARQRSGITLRYWRPLSIISYTLGGLALVLMINFLSSSSTLDLVMSHFLWFLAPALLPVLSLWRSVRRAWLWTLAGVGVAAFSVVSFALMQFDGPNTWHPFGMLFGTLAQSFVTGWAMLHLLRRSRVDAQLTAHNAVATTPNNSDDTTRGYLHHVPYMLLWLMTQGVGWMFVVLAFLLLTILSILIPPIETLLISMNSFVTTVGAGAALGVVYGIFSAWAQPWLMRLRSGKVVHYWRPLTVIGTTLAGTLGGTLIYLASQSGFEVTQETYAAFLAAWFLGPLLLQTPALWRAGRNAWLWPLSGITSAAVAIMILNRVTLLDPNNMSAFGFFIGLGFGQVVHVLLTGLTSLQILDAPSNADDNSDDADAVVTLTRTSQQDDATPSLALLTAYNEQSLNERITP